jgi:hypothetical protein
MSMADTRRATQAVTASVRGLAELLLLRESGMDERPIDVETRDKLAELAQLECAIGRVGVLALRPLMMATGKNIWQLALLGR